MIDPSSPVPPPADRLRELIKALPRYAFDQDGSIYGPVDADAGTFVRHEDLDDLVRAAAVPPQSADDFTHLPQVLEESRRAYQVQVRRAERLESERDQLKSDIDKFWFHVSHAYNIEPREYFEREARLNGFDSPLAMAAHYIWKRDPKVAAVPSLRSSWRWIVSRLNCRPPHRRSRERQRCTDRRHHERGG